MAPKIVVHWLENSRSQRILWLLQELDVPYDLKIYKRDPKTMLAMKDLEEVHPLGKSPVITIEEAGKETLTLAESGAICEFLIEKYGVDKLGVAPTADPRERANYLYWLHWAEGSAMLPLMVSIICAQMPKQAPWIARPIVHIVASQLTAIFVKPRLKVNFDFVESELAKGPYFLGQKFSGADIMMIFPVEGLESSGEFSKYPNIKAWFEKMKARPAYKTAEEKGAPNDLGAFVR